ncbi:MAG: hypothetical protein NUV94_01120 [Candidatus Acetothermia bacterium]|nr:hypothetical protein [Candidatus Acetothermia bacterium]
MAFFADPTSVHIVLVAAGTAIAMMPWLGLHALDPAAHRRNRVLVVAPVAGLAVILALGLPALSEVAATGRPFGPWHLAVPVDGTAPLQRNAARIDDPGHLG